jgi:biotin-[acetyl-CoA-carboxylase] ligase BirA-like protein
VIFEALAQARAAAVRMALRRTDRHAGGLGDLLERVPERILEQHHLRLLRRDVGERVAELAPQLGVARVTCGVVDRCEVLAQWLVGASLPALDRVETRIDDEPVQPGGELGAAVELLQADADLRQRLLRRVIRILRIAKYAKRESFNARAMAGEQGVERAVVAVLRPLHEHRVAQPLVRERSGLTQLERDRAAPFHGASLVRVSDLAPEAVVPLLRGHFGEPYRFVAECPSTQRLLGDGDSEGTVVATDHQTEGRGRLGRTWEDVPGRSLLFSLLLRPPVPMALWPELSLVAGESVARALRDIGVDASLRHPNDVVVAGRKVVGVLPEASPGRVVLGVGMNVNQTTDELPVETAKPPTSVRLELGRSIERAPLLALLLAELENGYAAWLSEHGRG